MDECLCRRKVRLGEPPAGDGSPWRRARRFDNQSADAFRTRHDHNLAASLGDWGWRWGPSFTRHAARAEAQAPGSFNGDVETFPSCRRLRGRADRHGRAGPGGARPGRGGLQRRRQPARAAGQRQRLQEPGRQAPDPALRRQSGRFPRARQEAEADRPSGHPRRSDERLRRGSARRHLRHRRPPRCRRQRQDQLERRRRLLEQPEAVAPEAEAFRTAPAAVRSAAASRRCRWS